MWQSNFGALARRYAYPTFSPSPPPKPATARPHVPFHRGRCHCLVCGTHTIADVGFRVAGQCPNCHSYQLEEL